jgi:hypothetical protein
MRALVYRNIESRTTFLGIGLEGLFLMAVRIAWRSGPRKCAERTLRGWRRPVGISVDPI